MRILLLNGHPDTGSLCDALAAAYADGAREAGHDIRCVSWLTRESWDDERANGGKQETATSKPVPYATRRPVVTELLPRE